jgi:hypothetical protein
MPTLRKRRRKNPQCPTGVIKALPSLKERVLD